MKTLMSFESDFVNVTIWNFDGSLNISIFFIGPNIENIIGIGEVV